MKVKTVTKNFIYGFAGLLLMNAVLSLLIYPYLQKSLGSEMQGRILYYTSLMNFIAGAFGSGANYARMKFLSEHGKTENGPYNRFLLFCIPFAVVFTVLAWILKSRDSAGTPVIFIALLIYMSIVRYYGDVQFRMDLNYKSFCLFYLSIGAGYLLGLLLYLLLKSWILIFVTGELFGILYLLLRGTVFRKPYFLKTETVGKEICSCFSLAGSYLLSDFVSMADRFFFPILLSEGDLLTSEYYYASVVGKMMSLLSTPLNGVLMGYLAREEKKLTVKTYLRILAFMLLVFVFVTAVSVFGSYLFVSLFYREHLETVKDIFILANAGQVLFFICNTLMVVVLRYTKTRNQVIVNTIYLAAFLLITIPLVRTFGLYGMAYSILIVNALKFLLFSLFGFFGLRKEKEA